MASIQTIRVIRVIRGFIHAFFTTRLLRTALERYVVEVFRIDLIFLERLESRLQFAHVARFFVLLFSSFGQTVLAQDAIDGVCADLETIEVFEAL